MKHEVEKWVDRENLTVYTQQRSNVNNRGTDTNDNNYASSVKIM